MGKRDLDLGANMDINVNAPRSKRRHTEAPVKAESVEPSAGKDEPSSDAEDEATNSMTLAEIREFALKVLEVIKNAVDKEGRELSFAFWRLPTKKQLPDYYEIIKRPVALDDVRTKVEREQYATLSEFQQDIETCFRNAKKYNIRDSPIWKDAKVLHKLALKEIEKLKGGEEIEVDDDGEVKKKEKAPNMHRMMKNRLQKLTSITQDDDRNLSAVFMELPPRKKWASYYQQIKKPICFNDIFTRIEHKKYTAVQPFIDDVNLVFENAMTFNEEHSQIWEDALMLRNNFQDIMKNLPAKYINDGTESSPSVGPSKIKLRLPAQTASHNDPANGASGSMRIRVPAQSGSSSAGQNGTPEKSTSPEARVLPPGVANAQSQQSLPIASGSTLPTQTPMPPISAPKPTMATPHKALQTSKSLGQPGTLLAIPPQNLYAPSPSQTPASIATPSTPDPPLPATINRLAPSPAPHPSAAGMYSVRLEACPKGSLPSARRRLATLTKNAGVRSFVLTVPVSGTAGTTIIVRGVKFAETSNTSPSPNEESNQMDVDGTIAKDADATPSAKKRTRGRPRKGQVQPMDIDVGADPHTATADIESRMDRDMPVSIWSALGKNGSSGWQKALASDVVVRFDGKDVPPADSPEAVEGVISEITSMLTSQLNGGSSEDGPSKRVNGKAEKLQSRSATEDEWVVEVKGTGKHVLDIGRRNNPVSWQVYLYVV